MSDGARAYRRMNLRDGLLVEPLQLWSLERCLRAPSSYPCIEGNGRTDWSSLINPRQRREQFPPNESNSDPSRIDNPGPGYG